MTKPDRLLRATMPPMRGEDVRALQQGLTAAGHRLQDDGIFGSGTETALRAFQAAHGLVVDGIAGMAVWTALAAASKVGTSPTPAASPQGLSLPRLTAYHSAPVGNGSRRWRLTREGVEVDGKIGFTAGVALRATMRHTTGMAWTRHGEAMCQAARKYGVPVELLLACACTESGGKAEALRLEPGYIDDISTPHRVSPGLMQTLISTARETLGDPKIDREALLRAEVSLDAGASYIARQAVRSRVPTGFDPPLVAIAYNAGSLRAAANPWGLVQTRRGMDWHADVFCRFVNDAMEIMREQNAGTAPSFAALLS